MKPIIHLLAIALIASPAANAEFRTWTRNDGKTAELDLVAVTEAGGVKSAEFKMRNGRSITLPASSFAEDDLKVIHDWKPAADADSPTAGSAAATTGTSAFDEILEGNLVRLSGKSVKTCKDASKPAKYYIFYYTASWCGPCQQYTPSLVEFYNKNKNDNFEIVLITSDRDEEAMEDYAKKKQMPWPMLKLKKSEKFKKQFAHGVTGIPSVITCDLEGKIVRRTESIPELEALVK